MSLESLLKRGAKLVGEHREKASSFEGARKLTKNEIDDLMTVVKPPVCIIPDYREALWKAHRQRILKDLEKIRLIPEAIPIFKEYLRKDSSRAYAPPGFPYGGNVADNVSAGAMQGTLNTRHTPGARQKGSSGIKGMGDLLNLFNRRGKKTMVVLLAFTVPQTFQSLMREVRPKFVELTLGKLIVPDTLRAIPPGAPHPDWYSEDDLPPPGSVGVEMRLRKDIMYSHRVTLPKIVNEISRGGYLVYASPLRVGEDPDLHIFYIPAGVSTSTPSIERSTTRQESETTAEETEIEGEAPTQPLEFTSTSGHLYRLLVGAPLIHITGLAGISDVVPYFVNTMEVIDFEEDGILHLDPVKVKRYGITANHVGRLVEAAGLKVLSKTPTEIRVGGLPEGGPRSLQDFINGKVTNNEDLLVLEALTVDVSRPWIFTTRAGAGPEVRETLEKYKVETIEFEEGVYRAKFPHQTVTSYLKAKIKADKKAQSEYEEVQRRARFQGNRSISLLRDPTEIELASVVYYAEVHGGTLKDFVDADILYDVPIDIYHSYSNEVRDTLDYLGIEGARSFLSIEVHEQYADSGFSLEPASVYMVVDYMTYRGFLTSFSHNAITSQNIGPLAKSAVKTPMEFFAKAAISGKVDPLKTSLGAVATGKSIHGGTSLPRVVEVEPGMRAPLPPIEEETDELGEGATPVYRIFVRDADDIEGDHEAIMAT